MKQGASKASVTLDPDRIGRIAPWLAETLGARRVAITGAARMPGGAVQENWRLDVEVEGGRRTGRHALVLRADAAARLPVSLDRATEFAVLQAAHEAGVRVAEPIARATDASLIGRPFLLQALVPGTAQARRIVRDPKIAAYGPALAGELGAELARIHAIRPPNERLAALPVPMLAPARAEVARLRGALDGASEPRPALEYVLCWLDANAPEAPPVLSLAHGDFRTGNYLVDDGRLAAILDWEFAHWGDGREDLGWFCARCWRFGGEGEAGGIAPRAALLAGYNRATERKVGEAELIYWEILAAAKWATIAVLQGDRKGGEASLELALTGLMVPEMELDALDAIAHIEGGR
jgi:aminoglycoside phosphotransferase (APT) family kinase protein